MTRIDSSGGWLASVADLARFASAVRGASGMPEILRPVTVATMATPTVHPRYAYGWGVLRGTWWHDGILPGTTAIIATAPSGLCWTALANSSRQNSYRGIDRMARIMIRSVRRWSNAIGAQPFRSHGE